MLSSPRRPSSTMRIFSSAEWCRRVALRISRTVFSALSGMRLLACLIVAPQRGHDEPAILSYAITSFCPTSADGLHCPTSADGLQRRERAADPLHCPDVTLKALVRGGELKVDDLGDLTYSVDRVLVLGPSQSFCAGRELAAMFPRCSSLQPQPGSRSPQRR